MWSEFMFKVGDVVRVRNTIQHNLWYVGWEEPEVLSEPHDTGIIVNKDRWGWKVSRGSFGGFEPGGKLTRGPLMKSS